MKFDKKMITTLLIGILIGGVGIGLIDANRPKPLFSSASMVAPDGVCSQELAQLRFAYQQYGRPGFDRDFFNQAVAGVNSCFERNGM